MRNLKGTHIWFALLCGAFLGHFIVEFIIWVFSIAGSGYLDFVILYFLPVPIILAVFSKLLIAKSKISIHKVTTIGFWSTFVAAFIAPLGAAVLDVLILNIIRTPENSRFYRIFYMGLEIGSGLIVISIFHLVLYLFRHRVNKLL